jgi:hypothetical protein
MARKNGQSWLGSNWDHDMTTYATTYGWRSTEVRRDLITNPPELNPVNGDRRGPTGVYETADPITTNQKVAGSSPAEHAPKTRYPLLIRLYPRLSEGYNALRDRVYWRRER